jgi:hypothetical protein
LAEAAAGRKRHSKKAMATAAKRLRLKSEESDIRNSFRLGNFDENAISSIEILENIGGIPTLGVRETADNGRGRAESDSAGEVVSLLRSNIDLPRYGDLRYAKGIRFGGIGPGRSGERSRVSVSTLV